MYPPHLSAQGARWSVLLIASLTAASGILLIVLGILALGDSATTLGQRTIPTMMMILGALVFLISFLGVFGTISQSKGLLYGFMVGLCLLVIMQLVVGIISLVNNSAVDSLLDAAWQKAYDTHPRVIRDVQEERGCCGFRYATDRAIPKTSPDACLRSIEFGYQVSCYRSLVKSYRHAQNLVGISSLIFSGIQILAIFMTYSLIHHLPELKTHGPGSHPYSTIGYPYASGGDDTIERQRLFPTDPYGRSMDPTVMYYGGVGTTGATTGGGGAEAQQQQTSTTTAPGARSIPVAP
ncbi:Tetraspanin family-domain-containing protein [Blastocladiella britannica]|nr:Tetraspanin family-domain-containing protein [Blastocladiella britannica]